MRYLITGGAGFIGSNIAFEGARHGHDLTILDNLSTGYLENLDGVKVHFVEGDVRDAALLLDLAQGMDGVFHLAASVGNLKSIEFPLEDLEINYRGTLNVLEAVRHNRVPVMIYSSTGAGYGEPLWLPVDEQHPFQPDSPYGVSKIAGEKLALAYSKIYGFRVVSLRYFNAYGINQRFDAYGNVIPIFATRLLNGLTLTVFGDGEQTRDFINTLPGPIGSQPPKLIWQVFSMSQLVVKPRSTS
jgi:UDP-glucose 4-epimerase